MDDKVNEKKLSNFDAEYHEYNEVQDTPDESTIQQEEQCLIDGNNRVTATDIPPPLPAPKQKQSVKGSSHSKNKLKSKIPRSPSLASSLNNTSIIIPPETPQLPLHYSTKGKLMSEGSKGAVASNIAQNSSQLNQNAGNANIMGGAVKISHENVNAMGISTAGSNGNGNQRSSISMVPARRPQIQVSPIAESPKNFQYLTLTVRKDENGYGMKVSGDNPVFVESVKPGGAAQIAGLIAGDMILKVNGQEVRSEKHPTVVSLIKASTIVELAVKRSQKIVRPSSVNVVPSTPILSGRDRTASITGPQPVDSIKRREMETFKIQTLQKMLEQEKLNLERLKGDTNNPSYKLSETNILKLREQLRQVGAEDAPTANLQQNSNNKNKNLLSSNQNHNLSTSSHQQTHHQHNHHQATTPQPQSQHSSPAFLSLLPRSLSSLSLGTRKNKIEKDVLSSQLNNATDLLHNNNPNMIGTSTNVPHINMSQSLHQPQTQFQRSSTQQQFFYHPQNHPYPKEGAQHQKHKEQKTSNSKNKNKFVSQSNSLIEEDVPPPLPQRNPPRPLHLDVPNSGINNNNISSTSNAAFALISDLDLNSPQRHSLQAQISSANQQQAQSNSKSKRSKTKTKALSDPKMSTQMFLQMETTAGSVNNNTVDNNEVDCVPPPLPPRQPGLTDDSHRGSVHNLNVNNCAGQNRAAPNSVDSILNYPLVSTCTAVHRDNMAAAFPLSQRPNIVQQLQQHQQLQQQQQQQQQQHMSVSALGQTPQNVNLNNKHRRVVSSPENMQPKNAERQHKATSGSWELIEKDGEITPPGTPPPPYLTAHSSSISDGGIFVESHHFIPIAGTSHIPTTHSSRIQAAQSSVTQKEIISMEDEDASDQEGPFIDENGPFNHFQRLLEAENVAFLAIFLNYVLSNSEPAPLLFYLITGLYKEGTAKDMRKWAYEIHSTFLVPRAPLAWYRQDESLAREVDNVLQTEFDKVEILRKVFWKSRKRARDIICEQLRDFQHKRTAGLGTIYGPTDAQLTEAKGDKQREQHIFEETLMRKLQILIDEYEKELPIEDPKKLALCSALSTVIHRIFITRSHPNSIIDRVHHFVSREKSFKSRLMGKNRKMTVRGHPLVLRQYYEVTHCNHCQTIIWGVSPQGYHCTDCKLNIHRSCSKVLDESCPGPVPQSKRKDPHNDNKISKFMGKIRPRTSSDFIAMEKRARHEEELEPLELTNERLNTTSIVRQPSDRRPDTNNASIRSNGNTSIGLNSSDLQSSFNASASFPDSVCIAAGSIADTGAGHGLNTSQNVTTPVQGVSAASGNVPSNVSFLNAGLNALDASLEGGKDARRERYHHQHNKSTPVSVNRSESYKERLSNKRNRHSRRKTSDPSLTSRPNDEQTTDIGLSNANYTASSNSSLSSGAGSESPSTSMEQVGVAAAVTTPASQQHHHAHHTHHHSHQDSFHGSIGSTGSNNASFWGSSNPATGQSIRQWNFESDEEDDLNETDWSSLVAAEILATLTDAEKKRQEIINEIYQTERSHVRTLKLLDRLFFCPLQENSVLSQDHLMLLFPPALLSLRDLHSSFEQKLKLRRQEHNHVVNHIGDLLASMFDGPAGEDLREYAAQFCARQQIALEALKEKRRKDEQLQKLLNKAESHKACRRLQLKDLLPAVLQRLTKYPLLFENLYKVTIRVVPENTSEAEAIQRALESSKKILVDVNQAVKTAEDAHKLQNIQRKLDKSTFDKDEFKNLDLTQYRLIHDGSLTMKKNPSIQLHGLLFETMIVLLTKQDDKYSLKYLHAARNTEVNNKPVSPIMSIDSETLVRQEAADKNSFFLIKTKTSQMLELRAPSSSECKTWFKHISDAAEQYKPRSKNTSHEPVDDPAIATIPHSNTKESFELTPEKPPQSATATVITTPLAPMLAVPLSAATYNSNNNNSNINNSDGSGVQMRNERRDTTPSAGDNEYYNIAKMRLSHNDLQASAASVNRTMSTRSCGEANSNFIGNSGNVPTNGVTLRHTQSARHAPGNNNNGDDTTKRDSASIVYSNNSNDTRTLLMQSPLVQPTAIQISISPAHTAEPVLTPAERLRRLDASIRDGLLEKQKIICDMFRVPIEHFHEIVDIAAMPEAPKDSADIALAAYEQVQALMKVLNDFMRVTPEQVISAVSTAVCDQCNERDSHQQKNKNVASNHTPLVAAVTQEDIPNAPPPLPPPNKIQSQAQQQTPSSTVTKSQHPSLDESEIHEDDDGYCEIDELRLPGLPNQLKFESADTTPPPLPPPINSFKVPKTPVPEPAAQTESSGIAETNASTSTKPTLEENAITESVKRQSTLSVDSIPEESSDDIRKENLETIENEIKEKMEGADDDENDELHSTKNKEKEKQSTENETNIDAANETSQLITEQNDLPVEANESEINGTEVDVPTSIADDHTQETVDATNQATVGELPHSQIACTMVDSSTQTGTVLSDNNTGALPTNTVQCGINRLQHVNSLEPSIPCHALNNIVSALNEHISLLLPKINERDMERERLRKENQHLRELLSAMHERKRTQEVSDTQQIENVGDTTSISITRTDTTDGIAISAFESSDS